MERSTGQQRSGAGEVEQRERAGVTAGTKGLTGGPCRSATQGAGAGVRVREGLGADRWARSRWRVQGGAELLAARWGLS